MAKPNWGAELLKTSREMFGVSLRTPKNTAELSNAKDEIFGTEKLASRLLVLSKALRKVSIFNLLLSIAI